MTKYALPFTTDVKGMYFVNFVFFIYRHYANLYRHSTRMVANPELGYRYQHQGFQTPETRRLMLVDRQGKVNYILNPGGGRGQS